jgi:hypothetical protein
MDMSWPLVESACGLYDFSLFDALYAEARAADVELTLILDYNSPCYPSQPPESLGCNDPACVRAFHAFAAAAAAHFAGAQGILFECQNEPNGMGEDTPATIAELCGGAGGHFAAARLPFYGPATLQFDVPYLTAAAAAGLFANLSAASTHAFGAYPPEAALLNYSLLTALPSVRGVVQSEAGFPGAPPRCAPAGYPAVPSAQAALYLVRTSLVALLAGAERTFSFQWKDSADNASSCDDGWGVVTSTLAVKPQFLALSALQGAVGDAKGLLGRVPVEGGGGGGFALAFEGGAFAAWDPAGAECATGSGAAACGPPAAAGNASLCLLSPGCCFNEYRGDGGPPCFLRADPAAGASFSLPAGANASASFRVVDAWGAPRGALAASARTVVLPPALWGQGPVYLLPAEPAPRTAPLFSSTPATRPGFFPALGNGFLAQEGGPPRPGAPAALYLAGLYSGAGAASHRAALPRTTNLALLDGSSSWVVALDAGGGVLTNTTFVDTPECPATLVTATLYASRAHRELLVLELSAGPASAGGAPWRGCTVAAAWPANAAAFPGDTVLSESVGPNFTLWQGTTAVAEGWGVPRRAVAVALSQLPARVARDGALTFTPAAPRLTHLTVARSELDVPGGAAAVGAAAAASWAAYDALGADALRAAHEAAWRPLWEGSGVSIDGNETLAAAVNASLWEVLASVREDWPYAATPGGLATSGYSGHVFWDAPTWVEPALRVMVPAIGAQGVLYRAARLDAALSRGAAAGLDGAAWPWESADSGFGVSGDARNDAFEQHVGADVALAVRAQYYASRDGGLLRATWPLLNATCAFWACRFAREAPGGGSGGGAQGCNCSAKSGSGNWTVRGVVPPDEHGARHGLVDDEVYTNAAGAAALAWCVEAAAVLGELNPPALWADIAAAPLLPLNFSLDPRGPVHMEFKTYWGEVVNQADVSLLQWPLGLRMDAGLALRDLDAWAARTNFSFMFTGDASFSIAYLALGLSAAADAQLQKAFAHMDVGGGFFTWSELAGGGGCNHFVTGAGGLLQTLVYGYGGLRVEAPGTLAFAHPRPSLPGMGVRGVTLRGLRAGRAAPVDVFFNSTAACVTLGAWGSRTPPPRVAWAGGSAAAGRAQLCLPLQPFTLQG